MNEISLRTEHYMAPRTNTVIVEDSSQKTVTNPIITAASPLLSLLIQIRNSHVVPDTVKLRAKLIDEIKIFEQNIAPFEKDSRSTLAARYCICTTLDEAILNTQWGPKSIWAQQTLLSLFHQETHGGENFYTLLENMMRNLSKNLHIIEFLYLLLSLGFEGKFFGSSKIIREEIRNRVFQKIREFHGITARNLFQKSQTAISSNARKKQHFLKMTVISFTLIFFFVFIENYSSYKAATTTLSAVNAIGQTSASLSYQKLTHGFENKHWGSQ